MSEKRYYVGCLLYLCDKDLDNTLSIFECADLLNQLTEENEQLKFENDTLKFNYQREIQNSIDFCNAYSKTNGKLLEEIEKLEKKNEQLKKRNKFLDEMIYKLQWRLQQEVGIKKAEEHFQEIHKEMNNDG